MRGWRPGIAICAALCALSGCASSGLTATELRLTLRGANEIPPNASTASGKASFWVHSDRTLNGMVETSGIADASANLYLGGESETGPLVLELVRTGSEGPVGLENAPVTGAGWSVPRSARFSAEHYAAYLAGRVYLNVHSARYPEGEIRAQLKP